GKEAREFVYEVNFPDKTNDDRIFVEHIWARRKVGYLLDQIRANGESKELVQETIALAKKYGIATPYTSYLIMPDAPVPVASAGGRAGGMGPGQGFGFGGGGGMQGQMGRGGIGGLSQLRGPPHSATQPGLPKVVDLAREAQKQPGEL